MRDDVSALVKINCLLLSGNKPLPDPVLTHTYLAYDITKPKKIIYILLNGECAERIYIFKSSMTHHILW